MLLPHYGLGPHVVLAGTIMLAHDYAGAWGEGALKGGSLLLLIYGDFCRLALSSGEAVRLGEGLLIAQYLRMI